MKAGTHNIDLDFNQILDLVKQLPKKEKIKLSKELEKDIIDAKLTMLLTPYSIEQLLLRVR